MKRTTNVSDIGRTLLVHGYKTAALTDTVTVRVPKDEVVALAMDMLLCVAGPLSVLAIVADALAKRKGDT